MTLREDIAKFLCDDYIREEYGNADNAGYSWETLDDKDRTYYREKAEELIIIIMNTLEEEEKGKVLKK